MGHGSYTSADWTAFKAERKITAHSTVSELYTSREMKSVYDPARIRVRESRDSADHPESNSIIFGLDVTGSMGYLSEEIARDALNRTVCEILEKKPVTDPQILFAALGDASCDSAPLQVTQFESDIRIAQQLLDIYFEGRGGDEPESFNLPWYFAAKYTDIDCYNKRGRKGYLFTIGDATCRSDLTCQQIQKVFGGGSQCDYSTRELYDMASEKYHVFHVIVSRGELADYVCRYWDQLIPGKVIRVRKQELKYLAEVITAAMQLTEGMALKDVLRQWDDEVAVAVAGCLEGFGKKKSGLFHF